MYDMHEYHCMYQILLYDFIIQYLLYTSFAKTKVSTLKNNIYANNYNLYDYSLYLIIFIAILFVTDGLSFCNRWMPFRNRWYHCLFVTDGYIIHDEVIHN